MAAANVHFTEYVNVFLPSYKVSADVAPRTFAGAQPAASQPVQAPAIRVRARHGARQPGGPPTEFPELSQKAELCSEPRLRLRQVTSAG